MPSAVPFCTAPAETPSCELADIFRRYGDRLKTEALPAEEFIRRFLQHVLPDRFLRVRHYGLLANCVKQKQLARCRQLLDAQPPAAADDEPHTAADWMRVLLGIDLSQCPGCGGPLCREVLRPSPSSPADCCLPPGPGHLPPWDTSCTATPRCLPTLFGTQSSPRACSACGDSLRAARLSPSHSTLSGFRPLTAAAQSSHGCAPSAPSHARAASETSFLLHGPSDTISKSQPCRQSPLALRGSVQQQVIRHDAMTTQAGRMRQ